MTTATTLSLSKTTTSADVGPKDTPPSTRAQRNLLALQFAQNMKSLASQSTNSLEEHKIVALHIHP